MVILVRELKKVFCICPHFRHCSWIIQIFADFVDIAEMEITIF